MIPEEDVATADRMPHMNDDTAPTMIDVVRENPEMGDLLSLIGRQMEADAQHRHDFWFDTYVRQQAELIAIRHAVESALADCASGGTTAEYERTLTRISNALHLRRDIIDWYAERVRNALDGGGSSIHVTEVHPDIDRRTGLV